MRQVFGFLDFLLQMFALKPNVCTLRKVRSINVNLVWLKNPCTIVRDKTRSNKTVKINKCLSYLF